MTATPPAASPPAAPPDPLLDAFRARADALGVRVDRAPDWDSAAGAIAAFAAAVGAPRPLVAAELRAAAPALIAALIAAGLDPVPPGDPAKTRDAPLGLSLASLAIAETASLLLAESTLPDRAIGMLAASQLIVCPTDALVPSLDEAAPVLRDLALRPGGAYATLVTGPSRTADIERVLTVGVQGPARMAVVFVDDFTEGNH